MINHGKYLGTTNMDERGQIAIPCVGLEIKQDETFAVFGNPRKGTVILIKSEFEKKFPHLVNNKSDRFEKGLTNDIHEMCDDTVEEKHNLNNSDEIELDIFNDEEFESFLNKLLLDKD